MKSFSIFFRVLGWKERVEEKGDKKRWGKVRWDEGREEIRKE